MTKRILSALVMLAIFIPVVLIGKMVFTLAMVVVAGFALYEFFNIKARKKEIPFAIKVISYILIFFFIIMSNDRNILSFSFEYKYLAAFVIALFLPLIMYHNNKKYTINDATYTIAVVVFLGIVFNLFIVLRNIRLAYIIYLLIVTVSTDTFAHIAGSLVGKHKLSAHISPKKTIEGAVYGFVMATILASAFYYVVVDPSVNIYILVLVSATLSIAAILGDLIFSSIKRYYRQKDFGALIPGHGGVLDRIDSLVFVVLTFVLLVTIL